MHCSAGLILGEAMRKLVAKCCLICAIFAALGHEVPHRYIEDESSGAETQVTAVERVWHI